MLSIRRVLGVLANFVTLEIVQVVCTTRMARVGTQDVRQRRACSGRDGGNSDGGGGDCSAASGRRCGGIYRRGSGGRDGGRNDGRGSREPTPRQRTDPRRDIRRQHNGRRSAH